MKRLSALIHIAVGPRRGDYFVPKAYSAAVVRT